MPTTPYSLTRTSLDTITDLEFSFGTTRLLPPVASIPLEFIEGNIYTAFVSSLFFGVQPLPATVDFLPGFTDDRASTELLRCLHAHLRSWEPKLQHKIAGLGYLVSHACTITPDLTEETLH